MLPAAVLVAAVVTAGACLPAHDSPDDGPHRARAGERLDRDRAEQLRADVVSLGDRAFAAAAEAVGAEPDGVDDVVAVPCSGLPLGWVRFSARRSLQYDADGEDTVGPTVAEAWTRLDLEAEAEEDDGAHGTARRVGVAVDVDLSASAPMQDGSGQQLRRLDLQTDCVDVGEDLARDLRDTSG